MKLSFSLSMCFTFCTFCTSLEWLRFCFRLLFFSLSLSARPKTFQNLISYIIILLIACKMSLSWQNMRQYVSNSINNWADKNDKWIWKLCVCRLFWQQTSNYLLIIFIDMIHPRLANVYDSMESNWMKEGNIVKEIKILIRMSWNSPNRNGKEKNEERLKNRARIFL